MAIELKAQGSKLKGESSPLKNAGAAELKLKEDERYYIQCQKRKNWARVPITKCMGCEFETSTADGQKIEIGCGFPMSTRKKQKKINRPKVCRVSRDGLS